VAISLLTQQAEVVIANNKDLMDKTVTVNLKEKPIEDALDILLTPNNIPWYRKEDGTYVINATRPETKPETNDSAPPTESAHSPVLPPPPDLTPVGQYLVTEKIELQHLSPEQAMIALGLPPTGTWRRNSTESSPAAPTTSDNTSNPSVSGNTGSQPANPTHQLESSPAGPGANVTVPQQTGPYSFSNLDEFRRSPEDRDQYGQDTTGGRRPFQPRSNLPGVPPGTPGAGNQQGVPPGSNQTGGARGFVPPGIDLVAGLATDNSLLVQGTPDDIDELRSIVRLLDIAPQQVNIKVDVITVSASILRQFGAQWQFFTNNANISAGGQSAGIPDGLRIDIVTGNVQAVIGALTSNGRGRVITSPMITTQNNTPADIAQGILTYGFTQLTTAVPGGAVLSQPVPFQVPATTTLQVIPRVNRDGSITVNGSINVTNVTRFIDSPDGSISVPETNTTAINSFVRRVGNGETLVLGGLNTKTESESESKVPLLGDIPYLGQLFRQKRRSTADTQLLIFITPTLVTEHAGASDTPP